MPTVETVRGPVDTDALGQVLMHEHVFVLGSEIQQNYPDYPNHWMRTRGSRMPSRSCGSARRAASTRSSTRR